MNVSYFATLLRTSSAQTHDSGNSLNRSSGSEERIASTESRAAGVRFWYAISQTILWPSKPQTGASLAGPPLKEVAIGAVVAAVLIEVGKEAFTFYVGNISRFDALYGSVSSIIVLLIWLYFSAAVLLFGAEVIAEYRRSTRTKPGDPTASTPTDQRLR